MRILVIGGGGREHALSWKLDQSPLTEALFIAPGNAGTSLLGTNVDMNVSDFGEVASFIKRNEIDMLVIGPEAPLVDGLVDFLEQEQPVAGLHIIGPNQKAAQLEGSKAFAKDFMSKYGIPTAAYETFSASQVEEAQRFLDRMKPPYVLKADGLAAGKGVLIMDELATAKSELQEMLGGKFGAAGSTLVLEEFLEGIELSVFVLTDGKDYFLLPEAKDYKRIGEGDTGLNTGGMGAVSPVPFAREAFMQKVKQQVIEPTLKGLQEEGVLYKGFIFFGLMNVKGDPYVIEYNARMGDPETEVVIPRLQNDLVEVFLKLSKGELADCVPQFSEEIVATIILASGGYPGGYEKGKEIGGLADTREALIFHAGTREVKGQILTNGGRVLAVTCAGKTLEQTLELCQHNAKIIQFDKKYYRRDIGYDLKNNSSDT